VSSWAVVAALVVVSPTIAVALATWRGRDRVDLALSTAGLIGAVVLLGRVVSDGPVRVLDGWFVFDRVAATWTIFALWVVLAIRAFARRVLAADPQRQRFHVTSALAGTSGVALFAAGDLLVLAVVAGLSSLASAAVVGSRGAAGHVHKVSDTLCTSRPVAHRMAMVLLGGDALLLAAVVVTLVDTSSSSPAALLELDAPVRDVVALLVVVAALVRCAQIPFHGWLPRSLVAPTPASALLHAGLVNAGGVILIRFAPVVARSVPATALGLALATLGVVIGAAVMRTRTEVKSALVWSTTAQMGFMLVQVLVGLGAAAAAHLIAHGAYKSNLFLLSGSTIEHPPEPHEQARPVEAVVAVALAVGMVAAAVALVGYDLGAADGAAVLVPAFTVATLASILVGRVPLARRSPARSIGVLAVLSVATVAYLGGISWFKAWLDLPTAVPDGAAVWAVAVIAAAVLGGVVTRGFGPARLGLAVQAWVLALGRRPVLQASVLARSARTYPSTGRPVPAT
jgi:NADH:ubiquinone oxidoreductase subunit 5 (subunit L)/multisubunit Na+/H+ antiporter MnhA subunit